MLRGRHSLWKTPFPLESVWLVRNTLQKHTTDSKGLIRVGPVKVIFLVTVTRLPVEFNDHDSTLSIVNPRAAQLLGLLSSLKRTVCHSESWSSLWSITDKSILKLGDKLVLLIL